MPNNKGDSFGVAGFTLGLLSIIFYLYFPVSGVMAILGLVYSSIQVKRNKTRLSVAGLVLSIIGLVLSLIVFVIWLRLLFTPFTPVQP